MRKGKTEGDAEREREGERWRGSSLADLAGADVRGLVVMAIKVWYRNRSLTLPYLETVLPFLTFSVKYVDYNKQDLPSGSE